ncbi:hypothetical protein ABZP36_020699 [Zizania latifolia]
MASSSLFHSTHPKSSSSSAEASSLLRRYTPDFCAFAPLRPSRQLTRARSAPSPRAPAPEQEQEQQDADPCRADDAPSPSAPAASPAAVLRVGIVGFGNFGQFIAAGIQRQGHAVLATSRSDYSDYCARHGIRFFATAEALCEARPDVLLLCSSILSTEAVVRTIPFHKLHPDTVVADVLSVKQFPRNLLLQILPPGFGIVCTHPMFGPESGKNGWNGLPFVYDKVRVAQEGDQAAKCEQFLRIFEREVFQLSDLLVRILLHSCSSEWIYEGNSC